MRRQISQNSLFPHSSDLTIWPKSQQPLFTGKRKKLGFFGRGSVKTVESKNGEELMVFSLITVIMYSVTQPLLRNRRRTKEKSGEYRKE